MQTGKLFEVQTHLYEAEGKQFSVLTSNNRLSLLEAFCCICIVSPTLHTIPRSIGLAWGEINY